MASKLDRNRQLAEYIETRAQKYAQKFTRDIRNFHRDQHTSNQSSSTAATDSQIVDTFIDFLRDYFLHNSILNNKRSQSTDADDSSEQSASKKFGFGRASVRKSKGFNLFRHKNNSETGSKSALKSSKRTQQRVREGVLNQLVGEDPTGKFKWEKVKLVLRESSGGMMLEFYNPPKVRPEVLSQFFTLPVRN